MKRLEPSISKWQKHWSRLAASYEFNETLERFLKDMHKKGWPFPLEKLPHPTFNED